MKKNIRKLSESFLHAFRGLGLCVRGERNFRVHMTAAFYVIAFALMGRATATQAAILCICFGLTMSAELMNTAIERLCDRLASGYDGFVRDAKDIAAAGVFVCAVACAALTALRLMWAHLWLGMVMLVTVPMAVWFVFYYGRAQ